MIDNRKALQNGYSLKLNPEGSCNEDCFTIIEEIGRGNSCIVYKGEQCITINGCARLKKIIIKEFYPSKLNNINRKDNGKLDLSNLSDDDKKDFQDLKIQFGEGQSNNIDFYEYCNDHALPRIFLYGEANNTVYAVMDSSIGKTLSDFKNEDQLTNTVKLNRIASIMKQVCEAIHNIHKNNKLYLDCKPDNFFIIIKTGILIQRFIY